MSNWMYIAGGAVMFLTLAFILFGGNKKKPAFDTRKETNSLKSLPDVRTSKKMPPVKAPKSRPRRVGHNPPPPAGKRPPPPPMPPPLRNRRGDTLEYDMETLQYRSAQRGKIVPGAKITSEAILDEIKTQIQKEIRKMNMPVYGSPGVTDRSVFEDQKRKLLQKMEEEKLKRMNMVDAYLKEGSMNPSTLGIRPHPKRKVKRRGMSSGGPR